MNYTILKFKFSAPVHFGRGGLDKTDYVIHADTLFSALCIEAVKQGKLNSLINSVQGGHLKFSDALPYIGNDYYIPSPLCASDSRLSLKDRKAYERLAYIPVSRWKDFMNGTMNAQEELNRFYVLGRTCLREKVSMRNLEINPFAIDTFTFSEKAGLYICYGYDTEDDSYLMSDLLESLSYQGIGGKKSSGYGRFELMMSKGCPEITDNAGEDGDMLLSLSSCLPAEEELDSALKGAYTRLIKRSGFSGGSGTQPRKKNDAYLLSAGSCFAAPFKGCLLNVAPKGFSHPVYCYAVPFFWRVL